jgi:DNA-binding Lrp family transcriptional regulator
MGPMSRGVKSATTSRDAEIVAWLGRMGAAGAEHVSERFGISRTWAQARLAGLVEDGLLAHSWLLRSRPGVYSATRKGLHWQGLFGLPVFLPSPGGFEHAWQMANTAVAPARELPGWELLAEREIRLVQDERDELIAWARVGTIGSRPAYHRPDFALISPARRVVAVEVELTVKDPRKLVRTCRAWTRARHVERVYYLATPRAAKAVRRAIDVVGGADAIAVLRLDDVPKLAELEDRERRGGENWEGGLQSGGGDIAPRPVSQEIGGSDVVAV